MTGYYADKAEAGFKTVTLDEPEVTDKVIYKPLGKIIQVDENFNVILTSNSVTYENNPYNPRGCRNCYSDAPADIGLENYNLMHGAEYC